ncbi:ABC transporter substrate-binding protein [Microlunatus soli]|uniref:ABC-type glycerol-3-phosphate transport system, substrate-binding protein n=1 Tax=Microlunatus soli TaxID=630515 RepID=A0A1H1ZN73_9ACTN|nr:extracellular solute-binding protein [Microlunatus soli]SDT35144.1 ABC-type glycerol-3-phosphate transport system, substrate-binding protein [Microlunatus soli]
MTTPNRNRTDGDHRPIRPRIRGIRAVVAIAAALTITAGAVTGCSNSGAEATGSSTISYMTWESTATNAALDKTMKKYATSSGIAIKREASPNADYAQKLASLIMSKKAPDLFWCSNSQEQNLAAEGLLYDWSDHLKKGDGLQEAKFSPGSLDLWKTTDGKLYGIPTMANTYGFFYNKTDFTKAKLKTPSIGWTWDEMFADIAKLDKTKAAAKSQPLVAAWPLLTSPQGASAYSVANGGKPLLDKPVGAPALQADPTFREGAAKMAAAIKAGQMTDPDYDGSTAVAKFANGGIPLMFGGQWLHQSITANKPKFDWGYAPWPAGSSASVQPIETNGVCSPATLKDPDAAWKVMSYLDTTGFNEAMKAEPIAPIAYEPGSKGYYQALESGDAAAKSIAKTATYELAAKDKFVTQFLDPWATKAADVVGTSWNPALAGKKDVDAGIDQTVSGINKLIGK